MNNNQDLRGVKVLLLEGFARQTIAVMEALRKLGCHITTYNSSRLDMGYSSKYPDEKLLRFWDRNNEDASYDALLGLLKEKPFDVVIPMTDFSARMLSRHKEELLEFTSPAVNEWSVFQMAGDKLNTMKACESAGVPYPTTAFTSDTVDEVISAKIPYPVIIKPRVGSGSIGLHKANNEEELRAIFDAAVEANGPAVVQEFIPQTGTQFKCEVFIDGNGEAKSALVFDKTRWYPIDGGSTCCSASVHRPDIAEDSIKLLQEIGWRGYGDVDLIEDPRDGSVKVMEINPRITASVKVCFYSGVDFARQIVELETGREVTAFPEYRAGQVLRYFHTDVLWFIQSPDRFKAKPSWFSWKNTTDQIWNPRDPLPWFTYTLQAFKKFGPEMKKRKR